MKQYIGKFPDCEQSKKDSKIVLKEKKNKSQFVIDNPQRLNVLIIEVDGCVIREGLKCDYLILPKAEEYQIEIYLELKGKDIPHGVQQIETTIKKLSDNIQKQDKICLIVSTRTPKISTEIQGYKKKFKKNFNADLIIKNTPCYYEIQ